MRGRLYHFVYAKTGGDPEVSARVVRRCMAEAEVLSPPPAASWLFLLASELVRETVTDRTARVRRDSLPGASLAGLCRLSPAEREVLLLRYAGHSFAEISRHTGIEVPSVGRYLAGARRKLLSPNGGAPADE